MGVTSPEVTLPRRAAVTRGRVTRTEIIPAAFMRRRLAWSLGRN